MIEKKNSSGAPASTHPSDLPDPRIVWRHVTAPSSCDDAEIDRFLGVVPSAAIFPLLPIVEERCGCSPKCARIGKHPAFRWSLLGDAEKIAGEHGHGIATGARSGVFVVETDQKEGIDGEQNLLALGTLPRTLTILSPSRSRHRYFRMPKGRRVKTTAGELAPGVDVRGDGGFAVLPGSPHRLGGVYRIEDDADAADAPEWLLEKVCEADAPTGSTGSTSFTSAILTAEETEALVEALVAHAPPQGDRNDWRMTVANLLLAEGHTVEGAEDIATAVALALGADAIEFAACVRSTSSHRDAGGNSKGWPSYELLVGSEGKKRLSDTINPRKKEREQACLDALRRRGKTDINELRDRVQADGVEKKQKIKAGDAFSGERKKVTATELAATLCNHPDWKDVLWFDVLAQRPIAIDPPTEGKMTLEDGEFSKGDFAQVRLWLDLHGIIASRDAIEEAIWNVVRRQDRQKNAIADYLDSLPKATDSTTLDTLATSVLGCKDDFANALLKKTLVAAVRRARSPGAFHKAMLVLKGAQQCGKTPFVQILAGPFYETTGNGNLAERDTILGCQGKWLVEVEELSALGKADADALKTAISRSHDPITKKYEPDARKYLRSFILIGTTNKDEFLTDATGNSRYWVIECGQIDLARLEQLRNQIWAEADFLAANQYSNELDTEEERKALDDQNGRYLNTHPWLDSVKKYLQGRTEVASATEVLLHILDGDKKTATKNAKNEVAACMVTLGCKQAFPKVNGKTVRKWLVPETLAAMPKLSPTAGGTTSTRTGPRSTQLHA